MRFMALSSKLFRAGTNRRHFQPLLEDKNRHLIYIIVQHTYQASRLERL